MIDPSTVALFIPPNLKKFKLDLFERIGRHIIGLGGKVVRHDYKAIAKLDDFTIPIIGCTPQFRDLIAHWQEKKRDFIYWDRGYLRRVFATWLPNGNDLGVRGGYYRWHVNCFQMQKVDDVPDDRWRALKLDQSVKPWRKIGQRIVVADTLPDYWNLFSDKDWTKRTVDFLKLHTDREIFVRDKESKVSLGADLADAHALVAHGSIAAVEAAIMGCPVFVDHISAAKHVGLTDLKQIETPVYPDRTQWLHSLAYHQFNEAELCDGTLWRLIR